MENPFEKLTDEQLDERIESIERQLLELDLQDVEQGRLPDEIAAENADQQRRIEEALHFNREDWE